MKLIQRLLTVAVFAATISTAAQAELITYDSVVTDTKTGLTWLDLSKTAGLSINQVLAGAGHPDCG